MVFAIRTFNSGSLYLTFLTFNILYKKRKHKVILDSLCAFIIKKMAICRHPVLLSRREFFV